MPFGVIGRTGPGMRQIAGFGDRSTGRGTFGVDFGARHCNQWGLHGVGVRQCLNHRSCGLGFGVVRAVGRHCCIRWGPPRARGRGGFGAGAVQ